MAHQQSISEFLILLYQERILIADLYKKRANKRLYLKSELLKLCRENTERLDRLLQWEVLKPRSGKFELNQSLLESFSVLLRLPTTSSTFSQLTQEFKDHVHAMGKGSAHSDLLFRGKTLIRKLEESMLHGLEQQEISHDLGGIEKWIDDINELRSYLWGEQKIEIYRDVEMDALIQDLEQLLRESLKSLGNMRRGLEKGRIGEDLLQTKMRKLRGLQKMGQLLERTNLNALLANKHPVLLENVETFRPRIASQQVKNKSSLAFLAKFNKKGKKR